MSVINEQIFLCNCIKNILLAHVFECVSEYIIVRKMGSNMTQQNQLHQIKNYLISNGFNYARVEFGQGKKSIREYDKFYAGSRSINIIESNNVLVVEFSNRDGSVYKEKYVMNKPLDEIYDTIFVRHEIFLARFYLRHTLKYFFIVTFHDITRHI